MRKTRRPDRWYLAGALLILLGVSFLSYQDWAAFQGSAPEVEHNRELLQQVEQTLSSVRDAESGQRGFLLTGNPQYLDAYDAAVSALPGELNMLRASVSGEPLLRTRVETLSGLISEKLAELKETVALRQNEGFQAALTVVETNRGKHTMDDIRKIGVALQNEVYAVLTRGIRERQQQGSRTRLTTALGAGLLFVFLLLATIDIGRATEERDRLIVDLEAANGRTTASRDLLHTTLTSIGDAVIATDEAGRVTFMNGVAENLTGWTQAQAAGEPLGTVLAIVNEETRQPVESPVDKALREGASSAGESHRADFPRWRGAAYRRQRRSHPQSTGQNRRRCFGLPRCHRTAAIGRAIAPPEPGPEANQSRSAAVLLRRVSRSKGTAADRHQLSATYPQPVIRGSYWMRRPGNFSMSLSQGRNACMRWWRRCWNIRAPAKWAMPRWNPCRSTKWSAM